MNHLYTNLNDDLIRGGLVGTRSTITMYMDCAHC